MVESVKNYIALTMIIFSILILIGIFILMRKRIFDNLSQLSLLLLFTIIPSIIILTAFTALNSKHPELDHRLPMARV